MILFRKALLLSMFFLVFGISHAFEPTQVDDIRVEGIERTDPGAIFSVIPIQVGDMIDERLASHLIKELFKTGFFSDVQLSLQGSELVISVMERPTIFQVKVTGSKTITEETLLGALNAMGLQESSILDNSILDLAERELKNVYMSEGKYGLEIVSTVTPLERNRVAINFEIFEGRKARIKDINFVGNKVISDEELSDEMSLSEPGLFAWSSSQEYSRQKLEGDLENIRSLYLNNGFLDFELTSTQVQLSPDKEEVFITIGISEGDKFWFDEVAVAGDTIIALSEIESLVDIKSGEVFSRERLTKVADRIKERLGQDGYAYATVNTIPEKNPDENTIGFTMYVDAGKRIYVRRIEVTGNLATRDEVVRRELRQFEGAWYSVADINRSKQRLDLTGFFSQVEINTKSVPDVPDQVDLEVRVTERQTGNFSIGIGYSNTDRLLLTAGLSQSNFMGTGNSLGFSLSTGRVNESYSVAYTDPYVTDNGLSRTLKLSKRDVDVTSLAVSNFQSSTSSASVSFGVPLTEYDKISYGLGMEETELSITSSSPNVYRDFVDLNGPKNTVFPLTVGWTRDQRDSALYPTTGLVQRFSSEISTPVGDLSYYSASYKAEWFRPLTSDMTLNLSGNIAYADDYDSKQLPFYKNYYAGGAKSVRGFESSSLGPRNEFGEALGGKRRFLSTVQLLFPFPGLDVDRSMRLATFVDGGAVENGFDDLLSEMRYSAGAGFLWYSPVGVMTFNLATTLNEEETDKTERFQFTLGTGF